MDQRALEQIKKAPIITLFMRNFSHPEAIKVALPGGRSSYTGFPQVAEYLKLDPVILRKKVFSHGKEDDPYLPASDLKGWGELAKLLNKTLVLVNTHGGREGDISFLVFTNRVEKYDEKKHKTLIFRP